MSILRRAVGLFALCLALSALVAGAAEAQAQGRAANETYRLIPPQQVATGERIEVIDFFWYG